MAKTPFLKWFNSLNLDLPENVDPSPFTRAQLGEAPSVVSRLIRLGTYNVWRDASLAQTVEDFNFITEVVDVAGLSESRAIGKRSDVIKAVKPHGWNYYQGSRSDTAIVWNANRLRPFHVETFDLTDSLWKRTIRMPVAMPLIGFEDIASGTRFYVLCAHTQVRGYKIPIYKRPMVKQYREINDKITLLNKQNLPVFLMGDLNNPNAKKWRIAPPRFEEFSASLDYIFFDPTRVKKTLGKIVKGVGFDHKRDRGDGRMNSDHPFVYAEFELIENAS